MGSRAPGHRVGEASTDSREAGGVGGVVRGGVGEWASGRTMKGDGEQSRCRAGGRQWMLRRPRPECLRGGMRCQERLGERGKGTWRRWSACCGCGCLFWWPQALRGFSAHDNAVAATFCYGSPHRAVVVIVPAPTRHQPHAPPLLPTASGLSPPITTRQPVPAGALAAMRIPTRAPWQATDLRVVLLRWCVLL
jgi:hypothetical protein